MIAFVIMLPMEVFGLPDVLAEEQKQIMELTNKIRNEHDRLALADAKKLDLSAQHKADDMAANEYFSHSFNNRNVSYWINNSGYKYEFAGENLAVGFATADEVVSAWVNSPSHYANLVDPDFKDVGVGLTSGYYEGEPVVFVAQHFASPRVIAEPQVKRNTTSTLQIQRNTSTVAVSKNVSSTVESTTSSVLAAKVEDNTNTPPPIIKLNSGSVVDKYIQAKNNLTPITKIFTVARIIFLAAMIFFIWALLLKIFIEFKKQHPHVIMQTSGLIVLLFILWRF
jgi:hypothetical protein